MQKRAIGVALVLAAGGSAGPAHAALFTVGPSGRYATIQAALTEAMLSPIGTGVSHDIRVQRGIYEENLRLPSPCCGVHRSVALTGGWNATFTSQSSDPAATVIDGRDRGRVFTAANMISGYLGVANLTLREGYLRAGGVYGVGAGAGLSASLSGTASLRLNDVHVRDNTIRGEGSGDAEAQGAGAMVTTRDSAGFSAYRCRFERNMIVAGDAALSSRGGGVHLQIFGGGAEIWGSDFVGNWAYGSRQSFGGGLYALVERGAGFGLNLDWLTFQGNVVSNTVGDGAGAALVMIGGDGLTDTGRLRRSRFLSHVVGRSQLYATASNGARFEASDSLVADGRGGVYLRGINGDAHLTNLTVADNQLRGIDAAATTGRVSVFNTIAFANAGGDLVLNGSSVTHGFNLVGMDPRFRPGSYELDGGSPAADAGTNAPPAGLGSTDLGGRPRVYNGTVDIGAYEWVP